MKMLNKYKYQKCLVLDCKHILGNDFFKEKEEEKNVELLKILHNTVSKIFLLIIYSIKACTFKNRCG